MAETRFSRSFSASPYCLPSPDGQLVATLAASPAPNTITILSVTSLLVTKVIQLPRDLSGPVLGFKWSPSSRRLLVGTADQIHVFSALEDQDMHAVIRNPTPPGVKPVFIDFGATDAKVCMTTSLGLKLSVFDLQSSKTVEISNPKFYSVSTATNSFSFRQSSRHLAFLSRTNGKDVVSIHHPETCEAQRSWNLDTIDAHGLMWSPDGRWLVAWESPGHGHKLLFYTPDGNLFKTWAGSDRDRDAYALGPGIKLVDFSKDSRLLAIGDFSRTVRLLDMTSVVETSSLSHPFTLDPKDHVEVWQEQLITHSEGTTTSNGFTRATQPMSPASRPVGDGQELRSGPSFMSFDASSTLLATVLSEWPSTVWIWDVTSATLRSALLFHCSISVLSWHPTSSHALLMGCEGSESGYVWQPHADWPANVHFPLDTPTGAKPTAVGCQLMWLDMKETRSPALFCSDSKNYIMALLPGFDGEQTSWPDDALPDSHVREESPLELVPAFNSTHTHSGDDNSDMGPDDTFHFKRRT